MTTAERVAQQEKLRKDRERLQKKQKQLQVQQAKTNASKKKNSKKESITSKLLFALIVLGLITAYKEYPYHLDNKTVLELTDQNADHSYFDDVLALDETMKVYDINGNEIGSLQIEEAIKMLEQYVETAELVSDLDLSDKEYNAMTEDEKKEALAEYEEHGLDGLIRRYKNKNNTDIEKARWARKIKYISEYLGTDWLDANGMNVTQQLINKVVQSSVIETYGGLTPAEYSYVQIGEDRSFPWIDIDIKDAVSGEEDTMYMTPIFAGEVLEANLFAEKLNGMNLKNLTQEEKLKLMKQGINLSKRVINKDLEQGPLGVTYTHKR